MIRVKFWGVRGSIPCPGRETMHYGGNTQVAMGRTVVGGVVDPLCHIE